MLQSPIIAIGLQTKDKPFLNRLSSYIARQQIKNYVHKHEQIEHLSVSKTKKKNNVVTKHSLQHANPRFDSAYKTL